MYKTCSRCGKAHAYNYICKPFRTYTRTDERKQRNLAAWHRKSLDIRERANNLCELCREEGVLTYNNLEVHHITKIKDDSTLLLDDLNLICLCQHHHKQADAGEIDADRLRQVAYMREERQRQSTTLIG